MKTADWKRLTKPVLQGDGWRVSKALTYRVPVGWVLHGLLAEDSAANHPSFYLWMVRMPLVVPTDVVDLSWSERFGDSSRTFDPTREEAQGALVQAAELISRQSADGEVVVDPPGGADNVRMQEARAYGLVLKGDVAGAIEVLDRVHRYQARFAWEEELVQRAGDMRSLIAGGRLRQAVQRLETWRSGTLAALGVLPG
jgi:hypothetical protein